ncbi:MAG: RNA polymerase sigma factor [Pseudomonadota bacterium]
MNHSLEPSPAPQSGVLFDEMLVVLAQSGDTRAGARLYRRWAPRLARAARRYSAGDDNAQDIAQECWLAIWKGLPRLRSPDKFRSYAFAVLHRRGADHLRRVIRDRETISDSAYEGLFERADHHAASSSEMAMITQAFAGLPPDQRLAAHLHFVEGLTMTEIAEVQRIPEGTAKSRLFHARRKLKAALDPSYEGE